MGYTENRKKNFEAVCLLVLFLQIFELSATNFFKKCRNGAGSTCCEYFNEVHEINII